MEELEQWVTGLTQQLATNNETFNTDSIKQKNIDRKITALGRIKKDFSQVLPHEIPPLG